MDNDPKKTAEAAATVIDKAAGAAKDVIEVAAETAKELAAMPQEIPQWMLDHERADAERFKQINDALAGLATKKDLQGLATEKSVRDVVHWQKNVITTAALISGGGKWFYRAVLITAPFIAALAVIFGGWKWLAAFLFKP